MENVAVILCLVLFGVSAQPELRISLDELLTQAFEKQSNSTLSPNQPQLLNQNVAEVNKCDQKCVEHELCANSSIIEYGDGQLEPRIGGESTIEKRQCNGLMKTCCSANSNDSLITNKELNKNVSLIMNDKINKNVSLITNDKINKGCGYRNVDGGGLRIDDVWEDVAQYAEFPWTVAVFKVEQLFVSSINVFQCGGSLIHPSVVLTAAHCVSGKRSSSLMIRVGEYDLEIKDEIYPHQDRQVVDFITHERFHRGALFNDIALLFLAEPVKFDENVNTICLPPQNQIFDLQRCFASGWGKDSDGKDSKILKGVELPIVPKDVCLTELRKFKGPLFELHNSFICAGGEGKDTCKGDGGSPLVCPIPNTINRYYQAGIVAWGVGCGTSTPGVYTNLPQFRNWIDEQFQLKGFSHTSFVPVLV